MKHFVVETKDDVKVEFNFPTSISEISEDYLTNISNAITLADNYSLVALVYSDKLSRVILNSRINKADAKLKVTPIFVKAGNTDVDFIKNAKMKQRVVCSASQLALGIHVNLPYHNLTLGYFSTVVCNAKDKTIYELEAANEDQRDCMFIEFKVVPNCDIMGLLDIDVPKIEQGYINLAKVERS